MSALATGSRLAPLAAVVPAVVVLVGCATGDGGPPPSDPTTAASSSSAAPGVPVPSSASPESPEDAMTETAIRLVTGGSTIEAVLWDNPAARSLLDQLPVTLDFSDYGGQEVLAEPPLPLSTAGMPSGESAPAGTIGYYAPADAVVLYYADVGRYPGIVRIGRMEGDLSSLIGWDEARAVTIELADD